MKVEILEKLPSLEYEGRHRKIDIKLNMYLLKPVTFEMIPEFLGDMLEWVPLNKVIEKLSHQNQKKYFYEIKDNLSLNKF